MPKKKVKPESEVETNVVKAEEKLPEETALPAEAPAADEAVPQTAPESLPPPQEVVAKAQEVEDSLGSMSNSGKSDRQLFFSLDFNELDKDLTTEERKEWNAIYASYRSRSSLSGTIVGVDPLSVTVKDPATGEAQRKSMYCASIIPYRVRIVIPETEMWDTGMERPDFVLRNMVGATVDFIIIKVDRLGGIAIASRRLALQVKRHIFAGRPHLHRSGTRTVCNMLSVGPRRCLVECHGHDINLSQRELRYTAIPDLRNEYHAGQQLECMVMAYDSEMDELQISVKVMGANPFDGADVRHPVGSRRKAVIAGKYAGGVFCNLPDDTVCMCKYSYQHEDSDFEVGATVIVLIQRHDLEKKQMYGKILAKW